MKIKTLKKVIAAFCAATMMATATVSNVGAIGMSKELKLQNKSDATEISKSLEETNKLIRDIKENVKNLKNPKNFSGKLQSFVYLEKIVNDLNDSKNNSKNVKGNNDSELTKLLENIEKVINEIDKLNVRDNETLMNIKQKLQNAMNVKIIGTDISFMNLQSINQTETIDFEDYKNLFDNVYIKLSHIYLQISSQNKYKSFGDYAKTLKETVDDKFEKATIIVKDNKKTTEELSMYKAYAKDRIEKYFNKGDEIFGRKSFRNEYDLEKNIVESEKLFVKFIERFEKINQKLDKIIK